jgi:hypothetical protein
MYADFPCAAVQTELAYGLAAQRPGALGQDRLGLLTALFPAFMRGNQGAVGLVQGAAIVVEDLGGTGGQEIGCSQPRFTFPVFKVIPVIPHGTLHKAIETCNAT